MQLLLVEDDERITHFIKRGLEAEHYRVEVAHSGEEAIDMACGLAYQVIILDLILPDIGGVEVCKRLRKEKVNTPILMLTAKDTLQDKVHGLEVGADDYMTKPFAFEELLARIKSLLRRSPYQEASEEIKVDDLVMNPDRHEVKRGDQMISLTNREFSLLQCLMRHPGKVLSRTFILEQVWGYHYDTLTNVVDVYIRYLRKKIDQGSSKKLIQTVRDVGYKITE
ncbi:MAG: response regulator transcription factor [Nitrospira sp.]|nr:response regulator transcription factor [Candidatus Manganitrophaceae bacterium]HIL35305.1 response regulator transcription factor [Candidatus Manganitrophaceae bacterium]